MATNVRGEQREHLEAEAAVSMDEERKIGQIRSLVNEGQRLAQNLKVEESYGILKQIEQILPALYQDVNREFQEEQGEERTRDEDNSSTSDITSGKKLYAKPSLVNIPRQQAINDLEALRNAAIELARVARSNMSDGEKLKVIIPIVNEVAARSRGSGLANIKLINAIWGEMIKILQLMKSKLKINEQIALENWMEFAAWADKLAEAANKYLNEIAAAEASGKKPYAKPSLVSSIHFVGNIPVEVAKKQAMAIQNSAAQLANLAMSNIDPGYKVNGVKTITNRLIRNDFMWSEWIKPLKGMLEMLEQISDKMGGGEDINWYEVAEFADKLAESADEILGSIPDDSKKVGKEVEESQKVLDREEGYFMSINKFAKELRAISNSKMDTMAKVQRIQRRFKKLKRAEWREQFRGSVNKLRRRLGELLKSESIDQLIKDEITKLLKELKILEGLTLVNTVEGLKKLKKGDSAGAEKAMEIIERDSTAIISIEERLKKLLSIIKEKAERTIRNREARAQQIQELTDDSVKRVEARGSGRFALAGKINKNDVPPRIGRQGYNRAAQNEYARRQIQEGLAEYGLQQEDARRKQLGENIEKADQIYSKAAERLLVGSNSKGRLFSTGGESEETLMAQRLREAEVGSIAATDPRNNAIANEINALYERIDYLDINAKNVDHEKLSKAKETLDAAQKYLSEGGINVANIYVRNAKELIISAQPRSRR